jgi:hypothetical protein
LFAALALLSLELFFSQCDPEMFPGHDQSDLTVPDRHWFTHSHLRSHQLNNQADSNCLLIYRGSISSGHRPNEEEEAKSVEWDDSVQVRSFRPRFDTSRLFGWERQKHVSILKLDFFEKNATSVNCHPNAEILCADDLPKSFKLVFYFPSFLHSAIRTACDRREVQCRHGQCGAETRANRKLEIQTPGKQVGILKDLLFS